MYKEAELQKKSACNCNNFLKIKHKYKFVVRQKATKYKKGIFCYLSSNLNHSLDSPSPSFYYCY